MCCDICASTCECFNCYFLGIPCFFRLSKFSHNIISKLFITQSNEMKTCKYENSGS